MTENDKDRAGPDGQGSAWVNIGKVLFLVAALVAAWFILERLMGGK